ncbi:MAG: amino acid adenylation domain-containing protein [Bacteroidota bacterium]
MESNRHIAIIGMAGRFPDAKNIEELHENLLAARCSLKEISKDRIRKTTLPTDKDYQVKGYMEDIDLFDYKLFNISLGEAQCMDPHQRQLLEVVFESIENAGYSPDDYSGTDTSVYVAHKNLEYHQHAEEFNPMLVTGNTAEFLAARISRSFNLYGGVAVIDTSCSSSLVALHNACNDLILGHSEQALVCGVSLDLFPFLEQDYDIEIESPDGRSIPFSDKANGMAYGEAAISLLLKPLNQAIEDGDHIHATIRSTAVNNNANRSASLSAPDSVAQAEVMRHAWKRAGIDPTELGFIELHGSGTQLGDSIEIGGLNQAFAGFTNEKAVCPVSTIKANIGHTRCVAGLAGFVKAVLTLKHEVIYPAYYTGTPSPLIDFTNAKVYINQEAISWEANDEKPRYAAVSSIGFSGTNCHIVLQEAPQEEAIEKKVETQTHFFPVSSQTAEGLQANLKALLDHLSTDTDTNLANISAVLSAGRRHQLYRTGFTASNKTELTTAIQVALSSDLLPVAGSSSPKLIFIFSDQSEDALSQVTAFSREISDFVSTRQECEQVRLELNIEPTNDYWNFVFQLAYARTLERLGVSSKRLIGLGVGRICCQVLMSKKSLTDAVKEIGTYEAQEINNLKLRAQKLIDAEAKKDEVVFIGMNANNPIVDAIGQLAAQRQNIELIAVEGASSSENYSQLFSTLYQSGLHLDFANFLKDRPFRRIELPTYRFAPTRCWIRETPLVLEEDSVRTETLVGEPVEPMSFIQEQVANIWKATLDISKVSRSDNFFELGGDSLLATKVIDGLEKSFGLSFDFEDIFDFQQLDQLAEFIEENLTDVQRLTLSWREVLKMEDIKEEDDFFLIGGHSLLANQILNRIEHYFGLKLDFEDFFKYPTIRQMAAYIREKENTQKAEKILQLPRQEFYEMSHAQKRLWALCQSDESSLAYNELNTYVLEGALDRAILEKAIQTVVDRHESLRTVFCLIEGQPMQKIKSVKGIGFEMGYEDFSAYVDPQKLAVEKLNAFGGQLFDFENGPLFQTHLIRLNAQKHLLGMRIHHIIFDDWSFEIIAREIMTLYEAYLQNESNPLPPLKIQYKDIAAWMNRELSGEKLEEHEGYWLKQFESPAPALELPTDFKRPSIKTYNGQVQNFEIGAELTEQIRQLSKTAGASVYMSLMAALKALFFRYTGQSDITVGMPAAARGSLELENQVGFYTNTLPLRTQFDASHSFEEFLQEVKQNMLAAYRHQLYPLDMLVDQIELNIDLSRSPLFDVLSVYKKGGIHEEADSDEASLQIDVLSAEINASKYDLDFTFIEYENSISISLIYNPDLFLQTTIEAFSRHYKQLLEAAVNAPDCSVQTLDYLKEAEKKQLLSYTAQPSGRTATFTTLQQALEWQAIQRPEQTALLCDEVEYSYHALNMAANKVAAFLTSEKFPMANRKIALWTEDAFHRAVALFGSLKAACAVLPINGNVPDRFLLDYLKKLDVDALLVDHPLYTRFAEDLPYPIFLFPSETGKIAPTFKAPEAIEAALIFTDEDRTGTLQQNNISHNCLLERVDWMHRQMEIDESTVLLLSMQDGSGISELETIAVLAAGGTLVHAMPSLDAEFIPDPVLLRAASITHLRVYPEFYGHLLQKKSDIQNYLQSLCCVYSYRASVPAELIDRHEIYTNADFWNLHGLPIGGLISSGRKLTAERSASQSTQLLDATPLYIVDQNSGLVPVGVYGEVVFEDASIKNADLKKGRAIEADFGKGTLRFRRTNELARWKADGGLEWQLDGNRITYVKGIRIDTEQVKKYLTQNEWIGEATVQLEGNGTEKSLLAFVTKGTRSVNKAVNGHKNGKKNGSKNGHAPSERMEAKATKLTEEDVLKIHQFNQTDVPFPDKEPFYDLFQQVVSEHPGKTAVSFNGRQLSYQALALQASQLAHQLTAQGIQKGDIVPVFCDRSIETLVAFLALLKVGGVYLPFTTNLPEERIRQITEDCQSKYILTTRQTSSSRPELFDDNVQIIESLKALWIEELMAIPMPTEQEVPTPAVDNTDLAYMIFTSGSTGRPKGAMIEHIGMINHLYSKINELQLDQNSVIVQSSSQSFDVSIWQFLAALLTGGRTTIYDSPTVKDPVLFTEKLAQDQPTILEVVPSHLSALLDAHLPWAPQSLRYLAVTGEALKHKLVERWFEQFPHISLVNYYGPTEASDDITGHIMDRCPESGPIPIGKPVQNMRIYIVDEQMNLCPPGVQGEILVSGVGVGRGYLNMPEKTAAAFTEDPFREETGVRLYKTGDLGYFQQDGTVQFIGRKDHQVKIRGHRIELGEIEYRLLKMTGIKDAVITAVETENTHTLCAYMIFDNPKQTVEEEAIREFLLESLPDYMVPSYFVKMDSFPLTAHGKIDRKVLPLPGGRQNDEEWLGRLKVSLKEQLPSYLIPARLVPVDRMPMTEDGLIDVAALLAADRRKNKRDHFVEPVNEVEADLLKIWQEVLEKEVISTDDNFFDIGGHSLKAIRIVLQVYKEMNVKISLVDIFQQPNIRDLAALLLAQNKEILKPIPKLPESQTYKLSYAQRRMWILMNIDESQATYNIFNTYKISGSLDRHILEKVFFQLIERHESLRTSFGQKGEEPFARIVTPAEVPFKVFYKDLRGDPDRVEKARTECQRLAIRPFQLDKLPLFRVKLFQLEDDEFALILVIHHIISDGWSLDILTNEIFTLYDALTRDTVAGLQTLSIQYKDFAAWQNDQFAQGQFEMQREYWLQKLSGPIPTLELPLAAERPAVQTHNGNSTELTVEAPLAQKIIQLGQQLQLTPFMILHAAILALFNRYSGQQDILLGTPIAGRDHPDLQAQIGLFVNTLVLRNQVSDQWSFRSLLDKVRESTLEAYAHQSFPFDQLVDALELEKDTSRLPLFDVMIVWDDIGLKKEDLEDEADFSVEPMMVENVMAKFDLTFHLSGDEEGISLGLSYNTDLYTDEKAEDILQHLQRLLQSAIEEPTRRIANLDYSGIAKGEKTFTGDLNATVEEDTSTEATIAPTTSGQPNQAEMEVLLQKTIGNIINTEVADREQNFFSLGGDSIHAIRLVAQLYQQGYRLKVTDVLNHPVILDMAGRLEIIRRRAEQSAITGVFPLSPIQQYFLDSPRQQLHHYNQCLMIHSEQAIDVVAMEKAIKQLVVHHDALRLSFTKDATGQWIQTNQGLSTLPELLVIDQRMTEDAKAERQKTCEALQADMTLAAAPLLRVALFQAQDGDRLVLIFHHLVMDGVSWRVLLEDINTLYEQARTNVELKLPLKTDSFKSWCEGLIEYANNTAFEDEIDYWGEMVSAKVPPLLELSDTIPTPQVKEATAVLSEESTKLLTTAVHQAYSTEINEVLLTALLLAFRRTFGVSALWIMLEGHGREEILVEKEFSRTVGWFTSMYPLLLQQSKEEASLADLLIQIKEDLRRMPNNGIGYGIARYLRPDLWEGDADFHPEVVFNYLGQFDEATEDEGPLKVTDEFAGRTTDPRDQPEFNIQVSGLISDGQLHTNIEFNSSLYDEQRMQQLCDAYHKGLKEIIEHCTGIQDTIPTPSDFTYNKLEVEDLEDLFN